MEDDRPLSSEEMIRQAREEIALPRYVADAHSDPTDLIDDPVRVDRSVDDEKMSRPPPRKTPRKPARSRPLAPDPFTDSRRVRRRQANPQAMAVIVGIAMLVMGIAVALALFAPVSP